MLADNSHNREGIVQLSFAIAIAATCIFSYMAVSEKREISNHWQAIDAVASEPRFALVKAAVLKKHLDSEMLPPARELASLYRQQGKQEEAAKIYRLLWLAPQDPEGFVGDALELASLYSDMSAFPYAIESYKKILEFDRLRLKPDSPGIVRDLNNLGVCYRCYAVSSSEPSQRQLNLDLASAQLSEAARICSASQTLADDQLIVSTNLNVVSQDRGQSK
jgi:tetratricopeptide (TPR) repeat protein